MLALQGAWCGVLGNGRRPRRRRGHAVAHARPLRRLGAPRHRSVRMVGARSHRDRRDGDRGGDGRRLRPGAHCGAGAGVERARRPPAARRAPALDRADRCRAVRERRVRARAGGHRVPQRRRRCARARRSVRRSARAQRCVLRQPGCRRVARTSRRPGATRGPGRGAEPRAESGSERGRCDGARRDQRRRRRHRDRVRQWHAQDRGGSAAHARQRVDRHAPPRTAGARSVPASARGGPREEGRIGVRPARLPAGTRVCRTRLARDSAGGDVVDPTRGARRRAQARFRRRSCVGTRRRRRHDRRRPCGGAAHRLVTRRRRDIAPRRCAGAGLREDGRDLRAGDGRVGASAAAR